MFSLRSGCASLTAALLIAIPLHASTPATAADLDATAAPCVARVGVPVDCTAFEVTEIVEATGLPPGLRLSDGRITGTPTRPGISTVRLTAAGQPMTSVPVVVSDVEYVSITTSPDEKTLRGTRWNGTETVLHQGLIGGDVRGLGIHPNGSIYILTVRTLLRVERPGQVSVALEGLEAAAMDIAANGDIHIANRKEVLTFLPDTGKTLKRDRGLKVLDVLEDDAGDIWTIETQPSGSFEKRHVRHIEVDSGLVHTHDPGNFPLSIAANRGYVYVSTQPPTAQDPHTVVAIDHDGSHTHLLNERALTLNYSDTFGLLATDGKGSTQLAWGAPLDRAQLANPTFRRVAVAKHLRFDTPPSHALVDEFHATGGRIPFGQPFARVRLAHPTAAAEWSMPGNIPQHGVRISPEGDLIPATDLIFLGRHRLTLVAAVNGTTQQVTIFLNVRAP